MSQGPMAAMRAAWAVGVPRHGAACPRGPARGVTAELLAGGSPTVRAGAAADAEAPMVGAADRGA